ncbi:MAG: ABC transporter permease [Longicatena sp.]
MKRFLNVFKFEFSGFIKGKWYRVSTILICAIVMIIMFAPRFLDIGGSEEGGNNVSQTTGKIGLYDPSGLFSDETMLKSAFPKATITKPASIEDMKKDIKDGDLQSGIYIKENGAYEYLILDSSMSDNTGYIVESIMNTQYKIKMLSDMGLTPEQALQSATSSVKGETVILGKDGVKNYMYTYILIFALYFVIMFYGQLTATNVASEKGNRSMEILVTSTSTNALIFGKVFAGAVASILQVTLMLGVSVLAYQANAEIWNHSLDFLFNIPVNVLLAFSVFGTFGYLFYSFIFGALGSMVSKVEDVSAAIAPILMLFIAAFFLTFFSVMMNPGTLLSTVVSYLPFTSCMAMFARVAMGSVEVWEIVVSAAILIVSTFLMGYLGAKLYRHGTLSYGNSFKFKQVLKLLKHKN